MLNKSQSGALYSSEIKNIDDFPGRVILNYIITTSILLKSFILIKLGASFVLQSNFSITKTSELALERYNFEELQFSMI